jgi:LisH
MLIFFVTRDLNRLVMDYLVIEGYKSAAEEFSLEAGVQPAVDFASIESRRNIREALNRGDVQEAITRVNDLNPEVNYTHILTLILQDYTLHAPLSALRRR